MSQEGKPRLAISEVAWDAGLSPPGSTVTHAFIVTNQGDGDLRISDVVPGCGCTVASYDRFLPPQAKGKITVSVDLYKEWAGQQVNKAVTVVSNDPERPALRLIMKATVAKSAQEALQNKAKKAPAAGSWEPNSE
jgi:hypothetical protein